MKPIHLLALLCLGAIWGASFLFIGIAVDTFRPLTLMFLRVLFGGLILVGVAMLMRSKRATNVNLNLREKWRNYLLIGLLNSALPFTLIAFSELVLPVSLAAILNSTTPLFTAIVAAMWGREVLTNRKIMGITLGIIGVIILMSSSPLQFDGTFFIAVIASLIAACSYGTATVYASQHTKGLSPIYASIVQLMSASIILAPPTAFSLPTAMPPIGAILALTALIVLSTACAYLLYFYLLQQVGPTRTASVTFLVPVFGSLWGILLLHETFTMAMGLGMMIIFASVGLVTNIQFRKPKSLKYAVQQ